MLFLLGQHVALPQTAPVRSLVSRYVAALQQRDYRTIVELNLSLNHDYSIRHENPKFLWPKLIAEYLERTVRELKGEDLKPSDVGDVGDSLREEINDLFSLLPVECKWAFAEMRPGINLDGSRFTDVFLTVTYTVRGTSPKNGEGNPLKRTILEFTVMGPDNSTVMNYQRILAGDVLWSATPAGGEKRSTEKAASSPLPKAPGSELLPPTQRELNPHLPHEPTGSDGAYRIGGRVSAPTVISKVEPEYSPEARSAKFQGTVVLFALIGADGVPHDIKVLRPLGLGLDERAVECVSKWRFEPARKDGKPVEVSVTLEINFRLL